MRSQLLIFYLFVGLLILALFNLFLVLCIKIKGETPFYKLDPKSPDYKNMQEKYDKRASGKSLTIAIVAVSIGVALTLLQLKSILDKHYKDALNDVLIGPAILIFASAGVLGGLTSAFKQYSNNDKQ